MTPAPMAIAATRRWDAAATRSRDRPMTTTELWPGTRTASIRNSPDPERAGTVKGDAERAAAQRVFGR